VAWPCGWCGDVGLRTIRPMALTVGDREVRPLTADEVMRMVELGILDEDEPSELLHGVLVARAVKSPGHEVVKRRLNQWLVEHARAGGYEVGIENPIVVPDRTSLPEPDIAAVAQGGDPRQHPTSALLVIEVAVSSIRTDTEVKPALYAAAGVPELWVVDVAARQVRRFTSPAADRYLVDETFNEGRLSPDGVAVPPIALADLFAGL
jgi:Uma2 family endonuclease